MQSFSVLLDALDFKLLHVVVQSSQVFTEVLPPCLPTSESEVWAMVQWWSPSSCGLICKAGENTPRGGRTKGNINMRVFGR